MRPLKRIFVMLASLILLLPTLTACTKSSSALELEAKNQIEETTLADITEYANEGIGMLMASNTYALFEEYTGQGNNLISIPFDNDLGLRWKNFVDLHGEVTHAEAKETEKKEGGYVSHIILTGEDGEMMRLNVTFTESAIPVSTTLEPYADDSGKTFGEKMAEAGMNTLVGILVVFTVLILLSLIISAFKFVGALERKTAKTAPVAAPAAAAVPAQNLTDDKQLVAVIAAAVAAMENISTDSFTITSIKRA